MGAEELRSLLNDQDGVVSRRQVLASGLDDNFIERRLRRKDWARVHRGVYVHHTGAPTWRQHAWAAVLFAWPAALCHKSAVAAAGLPTGHRPDGWSRDEPARSVIHVAIDQTRRVEAPQGVVVHRVQGLARFVQPVGSPLRVRLEVALLDVASDAEDGAAAVAVLANACQARRTTSHRLLRHLDLRPSLARRRFLREVLHDVASGCYSVLERNYLRRVERPHGLPTAKRQRRVRPGRSAAFRDVEYLGLGAVVELDGRLGHEWQQDRWDDLDRDIDSVLAGDVTLRLGWRQVLDPCRTASVVGRLLVARGWTGHLRRCGPGCLVGVDQA